MKRFLQRGKHLWKAKGRHGTHSPFVYAFVEQVMRNKIQFSGDIGSSKILTQQQTNLIGRTLQYLKPGVIYADATLFEAMNMFRNIDGFPEVRKMYFGFANERVCIVCLPTKDNLIFLKEIAAERICSVIMPLNTKDEAEMSQWELIGKISAFKMVLNAWYVGFVSNHPDFKTKQYFRLR